MTNPLYDNGGSWRDFRELYGPLLGYMFLAGLTIVGGLTVLKETGIISFGKKSLEENIKDVNESFNKFDIDKSNTLDSTEFLNYYLSNPRICPK